MTAADLPAPLPAVRLRARAGALPLGALLGGIGVLGALTVRVLGLDHLGLSLCALKSVTGVPCPTCGATRAVGQLVHLDLWGALQMNPLVTLVALAMVPWFLADLALLPRGRALDLDVSSRVASVLRVLAVALVGVNWLYLLWVGR